MKKITTFKLKGWASTRTIFLNDVPLYPYSSQEVMNHSPDGFAWGYGGSGPAQLALAIMLELYGEDQDAWPCHYQELKSQVIAGLPQGLDFEGVYQVPGTGKPDVNSNRPILIKPDNSVEAIMPADPEAGFSLEECYEYLDCTCITTVGLADGRIMVVDDESKLKDGWEKDINIQATQLYKEGRMTKSEREAYAAALEDKTGMSIIELGFDIDPSDSIAGNALVTPKAFFK